MTDRQPSRIVIVTGLSGAGKTTALNTFEDMGWEIADNLPVPLLDRLLSVPRGSAGPPGERPLAFGIGSATRGFDAARVLTLKVERDDEVTVLFLDCADAELDRRYAQTRRRHPLALDRPVADGIAEERRLMAKLRAGADQLIDTTSLSSQSLQDELRARFGSGGEAARTTLTLMSFGYTRGLPRGADLVLDMRYLRNPHWEPALRPLTGFDEPVARYIAEDESYRPSLDAVTDMLLTLLPRYAAAGKPYVTVAFGCTGGKHRSVHMVETVAERLRAARFSPTVTHRDLPETLAGGDPRAGNGVSGMQGKGERRQA